MKRTEKQPRITASIVMHYGETYGYQDILERMKEHNDQFATELLKEKFVCTQDVLDSGNKSYIRKMYRAVAFKRASHVLNVFNVMGRNPLANHIALHKVLKSM